MEGKVVTATHFKDGLVELVRENIEFNNETMLSNILEATKVTRHQLAVRRGEWVGFHRVGHDRMFHRKGWKVYRENWYRVRNAEKKPDKRTAVVASKIEPSITHLIEFGHRVVSAGHETSVGWLAYGDARDTGRMTRAFKYMEKAFDAGKQKLLGARVDNP